MDEETVEATAVAAVGERAVSGNGAAAVPSIQPASKVTPVVAGSDEDTPHGSADTVTAPVAGTRGAARRHAVPPREITFPTVRVQRWDDSRLGYRFVKRTFDIVFSGSVIAVLLVPSLFLCAAIAIDSPGWPLYGQRRLGRMGADGKPREFTIWKFRSMVKGADKMLKDLLDKNEVGGAMFKMHDDPRVTRIGKFMRKHSIDEFPQFINVFLGDMSVVGPRPPPSA